MATVTITITDKPNGKVHTEFNPRVESLVRVIESGNTVTSAEAYALFLQRMIREESKRQGPMTIEIPRIGK